MCAEFLPKIYLVSGYRGVGRNTFYQQVAGIKPMNWYAYHLNSRPLKLSPQITRSNFIDVSRKNIKLDRDVMIMDWTLPLQEQVLRKEFPNVVTFRLFRPNILLQDKIDFVEKALDQNQADYLLVTESPKGFEDAIFHLPQYRFFNPVNVNISSD